MKNIEQATNNEIEIQPIGSCFETDNEGYLINPAGTEKIQEEWKAVIEEVSSRA